jgi:hypothetical protein
MKVLQLAASEENISDELKHQIASVQEQQEKSRLLISERYRSLLKTLESWIGDIDDIPD